MAVPRVLYCEDICPNAHDVDLYSQSTETGADDKAKAGVRSAARHALPCERASDPIRILLIEDSEAEAHLAQYNLTKASIRNYRVDWAPSAEEALERIQAESYDVALVDQRLDGITGLEFLAIVQKMDHELPCIVLTGDPDPNTDLKAMELGAVDYLTKDDLTPALLERSIRYAISRADSERRLKRAIRRDALTGVHNRTSLFEQLESSIERYQRTERALALLVLDLNGFKNVNDTMGHQAGDQLLKAVAERIVDAVRPYDGVARIGGDEFVVLVDDLPIHDPSGADESSVASMLLDLAKRIQGRIAIPINIQAQSLVISGSIGIAYCPRHGVTAQSLLNAADQAMYRSKRSGGLPVLYDPSIDDTHFFAAKKSFGMPDGFLELAFQPQVDMTSDVIRGCEALLRWTKANGQTLMPSDCLPAFRRSGTISEVGDSVRELASSQASAWLKEGLALPWISVNLSVAELFHSTLVGKVENLLSRFSVPLEIEVSDKEIFPDDLRARSVLARLRGLGVHIAIDDFGAGASSLQRLRTVACDVLKLDGSFISNIAYSSRDRKIVKSIVDMANDLDIEIIAKGVENDAQRDALVELGIRYGQGFGFCSPMNASAFRDWYARRGHGPHVKPALIAAVPRLCTPTLDQGENQLRDCG